MQIPQSEATFGTHSACESNFPLLFLQEKEKIVKAVVKQENAVTAIQAIARELLSSHQPSSARRFGQHQVRWTTSEETVACPCQSW